MRKGSGLRVALEEIWGEEWYARPARLRARLKLIFFAFTTVFISGSVAYDLISGQDDWMTWMLCCYLPFGLLSITAAVFSFRAPFTFDLDEDDIRKLSGRDLQIWSALLTAERDGEGRSGGYALEAAFAPLRRPGATLARAGRRRVEKELLEVLKRLRYAGLFDDVREHQYDDGLLVKPHAESRALLERELERRERTAPLGPRSRLGALSA